MKSDQVKGVNKFKNFMATNRFAQIVVVLAAIVLLWVAYISISSLLSTMKSQKLIDAMAMTLGDDQQQMDFNVNLDNQVTSFKLAGSLNRQGQDGLGAEAELGVAQVDQDATEVSFKLSSDKDGQYLYVGDLTDAIDTLAQLSPESSDKIESLGTKLSDSWMKIAEVDDTCYRNIIKTLSDKDSDLRSEMAKAYVKNPLIKVHVINTLDDGGRDYYISPLLSNSKNFARDIKDSKVINKIDGCKNGASFIDALATQSDESVKQFKSMEVNTKNPNLVVTVKDGRMTNVRSASASPTGAEGLMFTAEVSFKHDETKRELPKPDKGNLIKPEELQGDFEAIITEAQQYAQQQSQMMPQMPMGM